MPYRLIGRTAVFGTVSLGSSPSGATKRQATSKDVVFFWPMSKKHFFVKGLRPKNPDLGPWRFGSKSKAEGPLARWAGNPSGATKR